MMDLLTPAYLQKTIIGALKFINYCKTGNRKTNWQETSIVLPKNILKQHEWCSNQLFVGFQISICPSNTFIKKKNKVDRKVVLTPENDGCYIHNV